MSISRQFTFAMTIAAVLLATSTSNAHNQADDHHHSRVTITEKGKFRFIKSNGIPDHEPGDFPRRGNPNRISEQTYSFRVPLEPKVRETSTDADRSLFGVAVNGVVFDPGTAEFYNNDRRSGWRYEAMSGKINLGLDNHHAHVQPTGAYHYHGIPTGLIDSLMKEKKLEAQNEQMLLLGYAADGFPIYGPYAHEDADNEDSILKKMKSSYQLKKGKRDGGPGGSHDGTFVQDWEYVESHGDLDEYNGRTGVTPEYPDGTYYYVLTEDFPFIPRRFKGEPDESFQQRRPPNGHGGPPGQRPQSERPPRPPRGQSPPPPRGDRPPPRR